MEQGLVHVLYGDGRGKTSAAMGLALRALGQGWRVGIIQFLKGKPSGEVTALSGFPGVSLLRSEAVTKFTNQMNEDEWRSAAEACKDLLSQAQKSATQGEFDMLILDEVLDACSCHALDESALVSFVMDKPAALEIVMTGHQENEALIALSDYVTKTVSVKHPFNRGVQARRGIEF